MPDKHTTQLIADRAGVSVHHRSALALIRSEDCPAFIREAAALGALVVGIEGFRIEGEKLVPLMDAIADFSGVDSSERSIEATERFLGEVSGRGLLFDFTFGTDAAHVTLSDAD